jgi:hypothetical protein
LPIPGTAVTTFAARENVASPLQTLVFAARHVLVMMVARALGRRLVGMSEAEAYEAGMSLPADARRRLALRLLDSVDPDEALEQAAEPWLRTAVVAAYDAIKADPSRGIPAEEVRAEFEARWAARS